MNTASPLENPRPVKQQRPAGRLLYQVERIYCSASEIR